MSLKVLAVSAIAVVGLLSTSADAHVAVSVGAASVFIGPPPPPPPPVWVTPVSSYAPVVHYHPFFVQHGHHYVQQQGPAYYDDCGHQDHRGATVVYRNRPAPRFYRYASHVHYDRRDHSDWNRGNDRGRGKDKGRGNDNVRHRR